MDTVFSGFKLSSAQKLGICGYIDRLDDGKPEALILYGPTGVGKTALAKRLADFIPVLDDLLQITPTPKNKLGEPTCINLPDRIFGEKNV